MTPGFNRKKRVIDGASALLSERMIARAAGTGLHTTVERLGPARMANPVPESRVGIYRPDDSRRAVLADLDYIEAMSLDGGRVPAFLEAGPRKEIYFDPTTVRAAIVTSGGIAPGLNRVIHSIVLRHCATYGCDPKKGGAIYGVCDGIVGLLDDPVDMELLDPSITERWLDQGGSMLGSRRHYGMKMEHLAKRLAKNLKKAGINILYIAGGDGSLKTANILANHVPDIAVVCIPKTMDNDILWVAQSFGFSTSVEKGAEIIRTLTVEAQSTRRVGIVELFGAESGFVTANAAHACGRANLVLIPEMFSGFKNGREIEKALMTCLNREIERVKTMPRGSGVIVMAEGVSELLHQRKAKLNGELVSKDRLAYQIEAFLKSKLVDGKGRRVGAFVNRPRHHIRAIAPNAFDQTYCDRLGALAVETGLAGYTRCVVSYWLSEYVLVPLALAAGDERHNKRMTTTGMFWKQIILSTGQPDISP
jgi:6-phosphofructokinase 1